MSYLLLQASAHAIPLADESVQTCVTSPPYWGLREYAGEQDIPRWGSPLGLESTPELYVEHMVEVFREVKRTLRPDGTLWLNLGDSYAAGGKGGGGSFMAERKDAAWQARSAVNGWRSAPDGLKPKDLVGIPWRVAFSLQADGWYLRSDIIWSKPNPMPESVTDRPTKAHEYIFLLSKSPRYYFDADAVREVNQLSDTGWAKSSRSLNRIHGNGETAQGVKGTVGLTDLESGRNIRTVWEIATQPYAGAHFATFPESLPERCIKAGSATGDVVLDPFNGSGTTGRVAQRLGRDYVGLDLSREYLNMAFERVDPITATARDESNPQGVLL